MNGSLKIGSILGIPIKIHFTFLIILFIFAWIISTLPSPLGFGDLQNDALKFILGMVTTLAVFAGVLLHELMHSLEARRAGIKIRDITLLIFGGVASIEDMPRDPKMEVRMAFAGPITSLLIGAAVYLPTQFLLSPASAGPYIYPFLYNFGMLNLVLGGFNLIPAFPMDGGRVLRAVLAMRMPYLEATRRAVSIGKTLALLMGVFGIFYSLWLIVIALFVYLGASEEERGTTISVRLEGTKVSELMTTEVDKVAPKMRLSELVEHMLATRHTGFPVVSRGRLMGIITISDVAPVPVAEREAVLVEDVLKKDVRTVSPDDDATRALKLMSELDIDRLIVMDKERVAGIVTRSDLVRFIQIKTILPELTPKGAKRAPPGSGW